MKPETTSNLLGAWMSSLTPEARKEVEAQQAAEARKGKMMTAGLVGAGILGGVLLTAFGPDLFKKKRRR